MWVVRLLEEEPTPHTLFEDVDSDLPYAAFVQTLYNVKVTFGCHADVPSFCPNRLTTKGEMAAFVARAYDLTDTDPAHTFPDVAVDHVFADNISALINADIAAPGCSDGATFFCVDSPIVAAQAVEWLHKASQSAGGAGDNGTGGNGGTGNGGTGNGNGGTGGNRGTGGTGGNRGTGGTGGTGGNRGNGDPVDPVVVGGGPGGVEYDIGPDGECTHWGFHFREGGAGRKSHVLIGEALRLDDSRTLAAGLYAHRHDDDGLKWWYWAFEEESSPPVSLFEGDTRIPCHHAECPTHDHPQSGMDSADYVVAEGRPQTRTFSHTHSDSNDLVEGAVWKIGSTTLTAEPPCSHVKHES